MATIELRDVLSAVRRYGVRMIVASTFCGGIIALLVQLSPPSYTAVSIVRPRGVTNPLASVGGLAANLGVNVSGIGGGDSPAYYQEVVKSRRLVEVARRLLTSSPESAFGSLDSLAAFLDVSGDSAPEVAELVDQKLNEGVRARVLASSGALRIEYSSGDRLSSEAILRAVVDALVGVSREVRASEAIDHERALAPLVEASRSRLRAAEKALATYLLENRSGERFPSIQVEVERLRREIALELETYTSLSRALTDAQVNSSKLVSPLHLVEPVSASRLGDPRRTLLWSAIAGLFALAIGLSLSLAMQLQTPDRPRGTRDTFSRRDS